ncbi:DUF4304 domain-containing protein [Actinospica robiniae]|uniref:DUF4304 domain-containing protein n=1 Tax=Actinospica robiniae TaxID=304901 RepID=UPI000558C10F|nr:DUF4304 domain-containing protein [Actinospica robiniae]
MRQPAGAFHVKAVADIGPIWRAIVGWEGSAGWASAVWVDKATGETGMDSSSSSKIGPSARDGYTAMMRSRVRPELKRLGFTGSGKTFTLPSPDHYATLSFQQSRGNSWTLATFTANLSVISHAEWSATQPAVSEPADGPDPDCGYGVGWSERLGEVSHHGYDYWWSVWAGFPTDDVADDLIVAIRDHALPAMLALLA